MSSIFRRTPPSQQEIVARQLREIEQQGSGITTMAHIAAGALLIAFSAGSLVALAGEALAQFITQWQRGVVDIPSLISFTVSFLLVVCMDLAMLVAASVVRMLLQRGHKSQIWGHIAVIATVSAVEAATFMYMLWLYERPTFWPVWMLMVARSLSAPGSAVYLSLARTLPIGKRDILYQVELVTGRGVIVDITRIAIDTAAPTAQKLALYRSATAEGASDDERLDGVMRAARIDDEPALPAYDDGASAEAALGAVANDILRFADNREDEPQAAEEQPEPPTDGGTPRSGTKRRPRRAGGTVTPMRRRSAALGRGYTGDRRATGISLEAQARAAWDLGARSISTMMKHGNMSKTAASGWVRTLKAETRKAQQGA